MECQRIQFPAARNVGRSAPAGKSKQPALLANFVPRLWFNLHYVHCKASVGEVWLSPVFRYCYLYGPFSVNTFSYLVYRTHFNCESKLVQFESVTSLHVLGSFFLVFVILNYCALKCVWENRAERTPNSAQCLLFYVIWYRLKYV
jgi:hypothetical protein